MWVGGGSRYEELLLLNSYTHGFPQIYLSHDRLNYGLNHVRTAYTDGVHNFAAIA